MPQRSTPDGADTSAATAEKTTSTTTKTTTTKVDGGAEKTYRYACHARWDQELGVGRIRLPLVIQGKVSFYRIH